jgi:hypothetical protein
MHAKAGNQFSGDRLSIFEDCEVRKLQAGDVLSCLVGNRDVENYELSVYANYVIVVLGSYSGCGTANEEEEK